MKKVLIGLFLLSTAVSTNILAQTSADYNYSIAARAFSLMQLPKILNQTNTQDYTKMYGNGVMLKFNDNQISYRISGNYFRSGDVMFQNTCETCEIAQGKVTDYSFKIGFEKNFNYSRIQPYFAFDIGYRSNKFTGTLTPANEMVPSTSQSADASKNGLVMTPSLGFKINIIPNLSVFAESSLDFYYSYEKQDITQPNLAGRTVNTYNKWEFLLNPVSAGIQFNFNSKN
ncbi:MAG: hypothetical protein ABWZ79_13510 [Pedobacter agri]|jgi:hypothetical protein|uniref:Outer membrane protein beta-barrel domain-containing protein n=1 Tax=Pedobacter agri TaxID=454586 RepID=A0A9X3DFX2_9SPHI|nr:MULTISPECIES: hypothetical protein [Pedobacter]AZI27523.1 hypothetical protein EA772_20055 [Pedobacter sp. G11]MCX3266420.1 hypothetical protein [Pedobacter agri]MDQ1139262.1 hypothetical protein [Pedobacter agri]RZJ81503.1 MAG: hypothetical protein EOO47_04030 [Flavobacterium sp.]